MDLAIETVDLGRRYGRITAIERVGLQIKTGELLGIVGADGAGKTTLMQMLAAILDPTDGICRVLRFRYGQAGEGSGLTHRIHAAGLLAL